MITNQPLSNDSLNKDKLTQIQRVNFDLKHHLSVLELCIKKYEEFLFLESKMSILDLKIRNYLIDDIFSFDNTDIIHDIQKHNFKINEQEFITRKSLVIALKNGLILFDGFLRSISQIQDRFKKVILKTLIGESFNKIIDIPASSIWNQVLQIRDADIFKTKIFNPSEFSLVMCQSFFIHLQMLEEIMNLKSKSQEISSNQTEKRSVINKIYYQKLEDEVNNENFAFDKNKSSEEDIDLVRFWAFLYSNLIVKVYRFFIGNIDLLTYHGAHQLKTDIEYVMNVLQSFRFIGRVNQFDGIMKILDSIKSDSKINLGEMLV